MNQNINSLKPSAHEERHIFLYCAACSGSSGTGAAYMYKSKDDILPWTTKRLYNGLQYKTNALTLQSMIDGIKDAVNKAALVGDQNSPLKITCFTYADTIERGFNSQREVWEANGFINRRGNKVKDMRLWQSLFKLARQYDIEVKRPVAYSKPMKSCVNLSKAALKDGHQTHIDNEVSALVNQAVLKDSQ